MQSRRSSLLLAFLSAAILGASGASAFYMPPVFSLATAAAGAAPRDASAQNATGTGCGGVFNFRNETEGACGPVDAESSKRETDGKAATALRARDVWSPPITAPDAATVWKVGETVTARWDAAHPPKRVTSPTGRLVLGHLEDGDDTNEHLDFDHPLADGFSLTQGSVQFKVPHVSPSNNYIVVLFGDSGNRSPMFTIVD